MKFKTLNKNINLDYRETIRSTNIYHFYKKNKSKEPSYESGLSPINNIFTKASERDLIAL